MCKTEAASRDSKVGERISSVETVDTAVAVDMDAKTTGGGLSVFLVMSLSLNSSSFKEINWCTLLRRFGNGFVNDETV